MWQLIPDPLTDGRLLIALDDSVNNKGRTSFAFSDVRHLITNAALSEDFMRFWPNQPKPPQNPFVSLLLRMVA